MTRRYREVERALLEEIVAGDHGQCGWLPAETDLAERFGCSRGVVREAIRALEERGVVDVRSARGQQALAEERWNLLDPELLGLLLERPGSDRLLLETIEALRAIEVHAGALVTRRARDGDFGVLAAELTRMRAGGPALVEAQAMFHHALLLIAGNRMLARMAEPLHGVVARVRSERAPERAPAVLRQHERIFAALRARDAPAAAGALGEHADQLARWLIR